MRSLILFLLLTFTSFQVQACECVEQMTNETARKASNVFVFRVLSTEVGEVDGVRMAVGKIKVISNVRGKTTASEIYYRTGYCCGVSMDPGIEYIGVLQADARRFEANTASVLKIFFEKFDRHEADELEALLRGKKTIHEAFPFGPRAITHGYPPPPLCAEALPGS